MLTDDGPLRIEVPRDREGSFEPLLIPKHERRFTGFDDKIMALYARGMTVREIQGYLLEMYGTEVSPDFISTVTDAVVAEVTAWQSAAAGADVSGGVLRRAAGEDPRRHRGAQQGGLPGAGRAPDGTRDILGLWIEQTEGAKFWMKVFNDLKTRGVPGHPDRGHRWAEGHARGAGGGVSRDDAADLHRAPDPQQPGLRQLEGPQGAGRGASADLHGAPAPRPPRRRWTPSRQARGGGSSRPSSPPGGAPGTT